MFHSAFTQIIKYASFPGRWSIERDLSFPGRYRFVIDNAVFLTNEVFIMIYNSGFPSR